MSRKSYHVIANINGGWNVKRVDAGRATRSFATQKEAIKYGRDISKSHATELVIHKRDGRFSSKESFGGAANPVRESK
ncbi:MAG: DUF2188 domain-containing protein [Pyrinomonadaceae bacterium]